MTLTSFLERMVSEVKNGSIVRVHYTGTLNDGTVFDTSRTLDPFEFRIGEGVVIIGFEKALMGMKKGETKKTVIPPEEAYGDYDLDLRVVVDRSKLPVDIDYQEGVVLQIETVEGFSANATVVELTDAAVTLDGNHPLAGETLNFDIELVDVF